MTVLKDSDSEMLAKFIFTTLIDQALHFLVQQEIDQKEDFILMKSIGSEVELFNKVL